MAPSKPTIIGLYGISGSGKSYLLNQLKQDPAFQPRDFSFYDGSQLISQVRPGGLEAFKKMEGGERKEWVEKALQKVSRECEGTDGERCAVITGHYMFWDPSKDTKHAVVGIEKDWTTYTHIIYLDTAPELVAQRIANDTSRKRYVISVKDLAEWQDKERNELREMCLRRRVLFTTITETRDTPAGQTIYRLKKMVGDFYRHYEKLNEDVAVNKVRKIVDDHPTWEKVLLLDADKTITPCDTGPMFWNACAPGSTVPLETLFKKQGYSYASFRQAALLHEEEADTFDQICDAVAAKVDLYPEMKALLTSAASTPHVGAIIVTCGLRRIWEKVLSLHNLQHITLIAGGRINNGYVVTPTTKASIVSALHAKDLRVLAYGDSPLDLPMLQRADEATVVVGNEATRSKSMDRELERAIAEGYTFTQLLLPPATSPRLNRTLLPSISLSFCEVSRILAPRAAPLITASPPAARLLSTPTRDATLSGHALRAAHADIGFYLAIHHLSSVLGTEETDIPHVQGNRTDGHRFRHEAGTMIVPLMRGGEPMAFGVSRALQSASFVHAKKFSDIPAAAFVGKRNLILVDSVINSGKSVMEFVRDLRAKYPVLRVVVVAGVVQSEAVKVGESAEMLGRDRNLSIVALRTSDNKFTGRKGTDTGHRIFGTTNLE